MRIISAVLCLLVLASSLLADGRHKKYHPSSPSSKDAHQAPGPYIGKDSSADNALAEVNAARAKCGLKPYLPDPLLTQAAKAAAAYRAAHHIAGHVPGSRGDFAFLPPGAVSHVAGCGALEPSWGWGACATYDKYTYCGAAWVLGSDGKRYMHAFYR